MNPETQPDTGHMGLAPAITTLSELRKSGWKSRPVKTELRENLIAFLRSGKPAFEGIFGYENTVIPELEQAILSGHSLNLLGLRGQAKTRLARKMTGLLDEWMPVIRGSELNDDPFHPLSAFGKELVSRMEGDTPVSWIHRSERYTEKLATPDVTVADLIGDLDPIKAANLKLSFSDERVIHYGLIPRANRGLFVLNELPDLQARIQVALFNILQEGDIQIRGFRLRLPLDIQFVFTANPEDYTNRGSIVTPLKDRIGSQILTHYPSSPETGKKITRQEARMQPGQENVRVPELARDLVEQIAIEARRSEYIDNKSGVSARLTLSAFENMVSAAERRSLLNRDEEPALRVTDLYATLPGITGKVELVYEGELEGPAIVARNLIGKAIRTLFVQWFPEPEKARKAKGPWPYEAVAAYFGPGKTVQLLNTDTDSEYGAKLDAVPGLDDLLFDSSCPAEPAWRHYWKEFILFGLAEYSVISKTVLETETRFADLLGSMIDLDRLGEEDDEDDLS